MLEILANKAKLERWRETPLKRILSTNWCGEVSPNLQLMPTQHKLPEKCFILTIVNGEVNPQWFDENLVPEGILLTIEKNRIQIKVIPNSDVIVPFVIYNYTESENVAKTSSLDISVEISDASKLSILFIEGGEGQYLSMPNITTKIGKAAKLTWLKMSLNPSQASSFYNFECEQDKDSVSTILHYQTGGNIVRSDVNVHLKGECAHTNFVALNIGNTEQSLENVVTLHHEVPNCTSEQNIKNLLSDKANALFDGMIKVHQDAQKTDANQVTRSILMSDKARAITIPRLEIYADDVRCTHGATVGFLEPDSVFYLRSRGINLEDAKKMLLLSYASEFLKMVDHEVIKDFIVHQLENDLEHIRKAE